MFLSVGSGWVVLLWALGYQSGANICVLCAFITLMAVSFFSFSLSLSPSYAAAGTRWVRSPLRPLSVKAGFLQLRLLVFVFSFFLCFTCLSLSSFIVGHASLSPTCAALDSGSQK